MLFYINRSWLSTSLTSQEILHQLIAVVYPEPGLRRIRLAEGSVQDAADFVAKIMSTDLDKTSIRTIVNETFDWQRIAERYFDILLGSESRPSDLLGKTS